MLKLLDTSGLLRRPAPDARHACRLPRSYKNWGVYAEGGTNATQPDNKLGSENCGVANWTQRAGTPEAWGWDDKPCSQKYVFMCRVSSKSQVAAAAACAALERRSNLSFGLLTASVVLTCLERCSNNLAVLPYSSR